MADINKTNKIIGFYDFEVFKYDWLVVIKSENEDTIIIHNNREELLKVMDKISILIGFNNNHYDDLILAAIISQKDIIPVEVWAVSNQIIKNEKLYKLSSIAKMIPTFDTKQELAPGLSLKEIESNLGMNIVETPISFDLNRNLTADELEEVIKYCEHDVNTTMKIFNYRKDYFESKIDICKEFNLSKLDAKNTRANLAAKVLKADPKILPKEARSNKDRLNFTITDKLRTKNIPDEILEFYKNIKNRFESGEDFEKLEKEELKYNLFGVDHIFAFGGIHGARKNFFYEGDMLLVDVGSYYPSMMINFNFISRASESPELFQDLYNTRMKYKANKDPKQGIYKILLNSTFGALKSQFNNLFDPVHSNNICINGQLILTDLIVVLSSYCKLIQSNTDGILIAYKKENLPKILDLCKEWEQNYNLKLDYDYATKIAQRDVNNYIIQIKDLKNEGSFKIKGKGLFSNHDGGNYEKNNLTVIDMALKEYYINDVPIDRFLLKLIKENKILPFQQVAKMGGTFNCIETTINGESKEVQKVNRIFATWRKEYGPIHKIKIVDGIKKYNKIPNSPDNVYIHNEDISTFDKNILDLGYYKKLIENNKFTDRKVIPWELFSK